MQALFGRTGNTGPLAMAVDVQRQAIEATPDDHPERAGHLNNLGAALQTLFGRTGDTAQLAEAVDVGRQAVQATPQDHPDRAPRLCNLGNALRTLFERTGDPQASAEAVQVYRTASRITAATVLVRLEAHRELAALLTDVGERLAAAESAVALLPQVNLRTLARDDREHRIGRIGSLAEVAAAAALAAGDPQRAVELLEATRGMLVADVIDARGNDVARLREHAPALAREFEDLRDRREALDRSSGRTSSAAGLPLAGRTGRAVKTWPRPGSGPRANGTAWSAGFVRSTASQDSWPRRTSRSSPPRPLMVRSCSSPPRPPAPTRSSSPATPRTRCGSSTSTGSLGRTPATAPNNSSKPVASRPPWIRALRRAKQPSRTSSTCWPGCGTSSRTRS
ncbi:hypothetical protein ACFQ9X_38480 [Catenulispora yoronensis]